MTRVLHIITGLGPGGAQSCLASLVGAPGHSNIEHGVVSLGSGDLYSNAIASHTSLTTLPFRKGPLGLLSIPQLARVIRTEAPDIIQTWLYHADLAGTLATVIGRSVVPLIWNVRCSDMDGRYDHGLNAILLRVLARLSLRTSAIVFNSRSGMNSHLGRGYRPSSPEVIPNGIDLKRFRRSASARVETREALGIPPGTFVTGCVGRFDSVKSQSVLLSALANLPGAFAVVVGSGVTTADELHEVIREHLLADRVRLIEQHDDIPAVMSAIDVYVSPSRSEGFPTVIAEAMACELPVIATTAGDSAEIVGHGHDENMIFSIGDTLELSHLLSRMKALSPDKRAAIGRQNRIAITQHYSLEKMIAHYTSLSTRGYPTLRR